MRHKTVLLLSIRDRTARFRVEGLARFIGLQHLPLKACTQYVHVQNADCMSLLQSFLQPPLGASSAASCSTDSPYDSQLHIKLVIVNEGSSFAAHGKAL